MHRFALLLVLSAFLIGCTANNSKKKLTIAVIPKGTTHEFWKSIHAGSNKAAAELNAQGTEIEVIWKGPLREDDREQQIQVVEGFAAQGVSGIVLAPSTIARWCVRLRMRGARACQPSSSIPDWSRTRSSASSPRTIAKADARRGSDGPTARRQRQGAGVALRGRFGEHDRARIRFHRTAQSEVSRHRDRFYGSIRRRYTRHSQASFGKLAESIWRSGAGIFTPNESSTAGMLLALEDIGKAGKVSFVGFDVSQRFIDALNSGQLHGIVVQNPFNMGYLGVKTMVDNLLGRTVEKKIDTGVMLVTKENMESPEVKTLLRPPLDQYLK